MELYEIAANVFGAIMFLYTTRELIKRKIGLLHYCFWTIVWLALILIGIAPPFYYAILRVTQALGMYTPIHFVTTFSILALFLATYFLGKRVTELHEKINTITQHLALQKADETISRSRKKDE